ncbi:MAG: sigma-70 family RNA polymerase sigma factor [Candidatus Sumerlaeota bacterium]|nr:sigma-70 family RNA polymerase sigma factor [Candidatus Sumerlaeota bacterium]
MGFIRPQTWEAFRAYPAEETFRPLYEESKALIYTICRRILRNDEDAADAFQAAYCRLMALARDPNEARAIDDAGAVLRRFAIREADSLRKRRERRARREVAVEELPHAPDAGPSADEIAAARQVRDRLETLAATLPHRYRQPVLLHYFAGMTQTEIAEAMGLSVSTIAYRIRRGLKLLRPLMRPAGLSESSLALCAAFAAGELLAPPAALSAAAVFAHAQAALGAGVFAGAVSGGAKTILGALAVKTKVAIVGAVIALGIAGLVVYRNVASKGQGAKSDAVSSSAAPGGEQTSAIQEPESRAPGSMPAQQVSVPTPASPSADAGNAAKAGEPTLEVQVVWKDTREPVAGAQVRLERKTSSSAPPETREQTTDDQGRATLAYPSPWSTALLRTEHPKGGDREIALNLPAPPQVVEMPLGATLFGNVYIEGENKMGAGAELTVYGATASAKGRVLQKATAGNDGSFEIPRIGEEKVRLRARLDRYVYPAPGETEPIQLILGFPNGPLDVILTRGARLSGFVRDRSNGAPVPGAKVNTEDDADPRETLSGADGAYELLGLSPGEYDLRAMGEEHAPQFTTFQIGEAPEARLDFSLEPAGIVHVMVLSAAGAPVEGAQVTFDGRKDVIDKTDAQGKATVKGVSISNPNGVMAKLDYHRHYVASGIPQFPPGQKETDLTLTLPVDATGVFIGRIADSEDQPVGGAQVQWLNPYRPQEGDTAVAGADGRYRLEVSEPGGEYVLCALAKGRAPAWKRGLKPGTADAPCQADFTLEPGHWIGGTVMDASDKPVEGVSAQVGAALRDFQPHLPGAERQALTDEQGKFRFEDLPGPQVSVTFEGEGWAEIYWQVLDVDQEHRIVMQPSGVIRGRAIDKEAGAPVSDFAVRLSGDVEKTSNSGQWNSRVSKEFSLSTADGRFVLKNVDPRGNYQVEVEASGYAPATQTEVKAVAQEKAQELAFELSKGQQLAGQVVDALTGQPIAGLPVQYAIYSDSYFSWLRLDGLIPNIQSAATDANGDFAFAEGDQKGLLMIKAAAYERLLIRPENRSAYQDGDRLRIPLQPAASVSGRVLLKGSPAPGKRINLNRKMTDKATGSTYEAFEIINSDADGRYRYDTLGPGAYEIQVYLMERDTHNTPLERAFELAAGEQKTLNLGDDLGPHALFGRVLDGATPLEGVSITVRPAFEWDYAQLGALTDVHGEFRIEGLKPGRYTAWLYRKEAVGPDREKEESVEINADLQHDFNLQSARRATARLVFNPSVPEPIRRRFTSTHLNIENWDGQRGGPYSPEGHCMTRDGNPNLVFEGRFKGRYNMMITTWRSAGTHLSWTYPKLFDLDTLEQDQDLGDILVPPLGALRIQMAMDPPALPLPAKAPSVTLSQYNLILFLEDGKADQTIEAIPVGAYEIRFISYAHKAELTPAQVEIAAGQTTEVHALLRPDTTVRGYVTSARDNEKKADLSRVALVGPGAQLTLEPPYASGESKGTGNEIRQGYFVFRGMAPGDYELTVEAQGYETHRATVSPAPGKDIFEMIHMTPLAP